MSALVTLVGITRPEGIPNVQTPGEFIAWCARVSNPSNQLNTGTSAKLLSYMVTNQHWSPFEMVNMVLAIKTTRDIARQILRHRSFSFQEFSQRYAVVSEPPVIRQTRLQHATNRQSSVINTDAELDRWWEDAQLQVAEFGEAIYQEALDKGIAKEVARAVLPEGMTPSYLYMSGSIRSWIHYVLLRTGHGTQLEHQEIASKCRSILVEQIPELNDYIFQPRD